MRDRRRMGDRGTLDRVAAVGADRCVAQDGPFGTHSKIVGYPRGKDYSPYLEPGRLLSSGQRRHNEFFGGVVLS